MTRVVQRLVPVARECGPRTRVTAAALTLLLIAGLAAHALLAVTAGPGSLAKGWLYTAEIAGAGLLCLVRAVAVRRDRLIWALLAGAILVSSAGNVFYYTVLLALEEPPFPSWSDVFWVLFFPPAYAALGLLVSRHLRGMPRSIWLDGGIAALALAAVGAGLVLPSILESTAGASPSAVATTLVYPSGDLILLMMVIVTVALSGWRPGGAWGLIGLGLAVTALADTIYCLRVALGTYVDGTLLDSLWPAGMLLIGFAAWQPSKPVRRRLEGASALAIPYAFTIVALGMLLLDHFGDASGLAVALAAAAVALAGFRTLRTFTELRDLGDSRRLALTDDLTGLGNRRDLQLRLAALERAPAGSSAHLLLIDLDRFKELNDTLGHAAGDRLLEQIGERLQESAPSGATICRLGGDEFAILVCADATGGDDLAVARHIRAAVQRSLTLEGLSLQVDSSIGVAAFPADAATGSELLQRADVAMYAAKRSGAGVARYTADLDPHPRARLALFGELRNAIATRQLVVHYQPQCRLPSGEVAAVEALVRWQHPDLGLLGPNAFIPLAERSDLMQPLTELVLEEALTQLASWRRAGHHLGVGVNIGMANLLEANFPATVAAVLERTSVPAGQLTLEITETVAMDDPGRASDVLEQLRSLGVRLSLDDFGTGHSSLAHLRQIPLDELKIDRSFVMTMSANASDVAIVQSTIDLARNLGLTVVAEGVEDPTALETLAELGCHLAQGYHLARPMAADALTDWLSGRSWQATLVPRGSDHEAAPARAPRRA